MLFQFSTFMVCTACAATCVITTVGKSLFKMLVAMVEVWLIIQVGAFLGLLSTLTFFSVFSIALVILAVNTLKFFSCCLMYAHFAAFSIQPSRVIPAW